MSWKGAVSALFGFLQITIATAITQRTHGAIAEMPQNTSKWRGKQMFEKGVVPFLASQYQGTPTKSFQVVK